MYIKEAIMSKKPEVLFAEQNIIPANQAYERAIKANKNYLRDLDTISKKIEAASSRGDFEARISDIDINNIRVYISKFSDLGYTASTIVGSGVLELRWSRPKES